MLASRIGLDLWAEGIADTILGLTTPAVLLIDELMHGDLLHARGKFDR